MSTAGAAGVAAGGKMRRQKRSRLRMHAPSAIDVARSSGSLAEWKVAIPLLSPLDIVSMPFIGDLRLPEARSENSGEAKAPPCAGGVVGGEWQHPAEPFYYEPPPANAPDFAVPRCT